MSKPNILCDTAGMKEDVWLAARAHGPDGSIDYTVGGSDVATIFGLSPWTTPLELWMIKKGRIKTPPKPNPDQLTMGHLLEPIAAYWYAQKSGNKVIDDTYLYQHADHYYALADIDRRFIRKEDGADGILECKSTSWHKAGDWANGAYPIYYELQLRYYLAVRDVDHGAFSCIWGNNPENDIALPELERDRSKEDMIFDRLDEWIWSLKNDKPPTMSGIAPELAMDSLAKIYGNSDASLPTVEFPARFEKKLRGLISVNDEISECKAKIKSLEETAKAYSVGIAEMMAKHEHGILTTTSDKILIDFVSKSKRTVDSKKLKSDYPDVYEDVLKTSTSRTLKVSLE